ncbi:MAG: hypothetical protein CMJ54_10980 [Planctomycetaceae bacterium]|nr:hypothetical protein [Planctomycetaceae bacterium]MAB73016.1 hypothetical protein [Planctomycetaceae bacterium]
MKHRTFATVMAVTLPMHVAFASTVDQVTDPVSDPAADRPDARSAVGGGTTIVLDEMIERRSRELEDPPPTARDQRVVHDARNGIRRITIELGMLGRERGDAATLAGFHAIRLDATMRSIDRLVESVARPGTMLGDPPAALPERDRRAAIDRLEAFNRTSLDLLRRSDTGTVSGLDGTLATVLAPLRDVFGLLTGRPLQSRWPIGSEGPAADGPVRGNVESPSVEAHVMAMFEALRDDPPAAAFDVTTFERVLSAHPFDPNDPDSIETWRRTAEVLESLQADRIASSPLVTATLRSAQREAAARRRRALRALGRSLEARDESTDPVLHEADLVAVRTAATTSIAIRRLDELATGLARMHPAATRKAGRFVAVWSRTLSDPRERDRTLATIERIAGDVDRYSTIDFEGRLRAPDPSAIELVGGRTRELRDVVTATRRTWVDAVTNGDTEGPAIDAMDRIARLGTLLEDLLPLATNDDAAILDLDRCDRWGGWYVDAKTLGWSTRTLLPGARLVVGTAIAGDSDRFERELTTLESQSPLVRLAAAVARRTEDTMATLPGGGIATIASSSIPPPPSAWGLKQRIALAAVCLGMAELVAIQADPGRDAPDGMMRRDDLADAVAAACEALLAELETDTPVAKEIRP